MDAAPVIAIVDDDASVRRSLLRVVRSAGYNAEAFASARAFLEWLSTGHAACLVLDVQMKEMSGLDLQERLAVPIVFITAHDDAPIRARIEKSGAAALLRKPFDAATVLDAIRRAVSNGNADGGAPSPAPRRPAALAGNRCTRGDSDAGDGDLESAISRMALAHLGLRRRDRGGIPRRLCEHRGRGGRGNGAAGEPERGRSLGLGGPAMARPRRAQMMNASNEGGRVMSFATFVGLR